MSLFMSDLRIASERIHTAREQMRSARITAAAAKRSQRNMEQVVDEAQKLQQSANQLSFEPVHYPRNP